MCPPTLSQNILRYLFRDDLLANGYHNEECKFRDRGSIPSVCQITDVDLGQVG